MALVPGWLADLLGFRAVLDTDGAEYPQRRLLRAVGATVEDNQVLGSTDIVLFPATLRWAAVSAPATTSVRYVAVIDQGPTANEVASQFVVSQDCSARYFSFICGGSALASNSVTATVRKNGADTSMVIIIPAGTAPGTVVADASHTVSFARGDRVSIKLVQSGTTTQSVWFGLFQLG